MSREKAIKMLQAYQECKTKEIRGIWEECNKDLCNNCDLCYAQGNLGEHKQSITIAISDMKKLEKIEQIIQLNRTNSLVDCGLLLSEIEQILRGNIK